MSDKNTETLIAKARDILDVCEAHPKRPLRVVERELLRVLAADFSAAQERERTLREGIRLDAQEAAHAQRRDDYSTLEELVEAGYVGQFTRSALVASSDGQKP